MSKHGKAEGLAASLREVVESIAMGDHTARAYRVADWLSANRRAFHPDIWNRDPAAEEMTGLRLAQYPIGHERTVLPPARYLDYLDRPAKQRARGMSMHDVLRTAVKLVEEIVSPEIDDGCPGCSAPSLGARYHYGEELAAIVIACDDCGGSYALDGAPVESGSLRLPTRADFARVDARAERWDVYDREGLVADLTDGSFGSSVLMGSIRYARGDAEEVLRSCLGAEAGEPFVVFERHSPRRHHVRPVDVGDGIGFHALEQYTYRDARSGWVCD